MALKSNRTLFDECSSFIYLIKSLRSSCSKKLPHGMKHNSFPFLTKFIFLLAQMVAVSHVGAWDAMEEIHLSEAKFCQIVSERKRKVFYKSLFTEYQLVKNPVFFL